jgi:cobalamin biosynthesis Co2+ chelatase CbiK
MESIKLKRRYTKPIKTNRVYTKKTYEDRLVQGFYYVKGKHFKEASETINELIKKWR